jgi:hypothetical protein
MTVQVSFFRFVCFLLFKISFRTMVLKPFANPGKIPASIRGENHFAHGRIGNGSSLAEAYGTYGSRLMKDGL